MKPEVGNTIYWFDKSHPDYKLAQLSIKGKYKVHYNSTVTPKPNLFLALNDDAGKKFSGAICGVTFASCSSLFSERFLPSSLFNNQQLNRKNTIEVGSLVSFNDRGAGRKLISALPLIIRNLQARYALVTITEGLQRLLGKLNIAFQPLLAVDASQLKENERIELGSYFSCNPVTGIIDVEQSIMHADLKTYKFEKAPHRGDLVGYNTVAHKVLPASPLCDLN